MNRLRQLEQEALAQGREWTRRRLEQQLQDHSDALPAVCPQTGEGLKDVRWRDLHLSTISGVVKLRVRHGYSPALGQWVCPARQAWGLKPYQRVSPELESRLAYTASETTSYEAASQMAARWGCPVSDGCIHQHLQSLGEAAEEIPLPHPVIARQEPQFSMVIMLDGWLARERGPDWGAGPRKKEPQRILWHEVKSAVIYRLERRVANDSGRGMLIEKFVVATPPETSPVGFGTAVQAEASQIWGRPGFTRLLRVVVLVRIKTNASCGTDFTDNLWMHRGTNETYKFGIPWTRGRVCAGSVETRRHRENCRKPQSETRYGAAENLAFYSRTGDQ